VFVGGSIHVIGTALLAGGFLLLVWGANLLLGPTPGDFDFDFGAAAAFSFGQLLGGAGLVLCTIALVTTAVHRRTSRPTR